MPLPVISDGYYCAYRYLLNGAQSAEVTFSVTAPSTTSADVGDDLKDAWDSHIKDAVADVNELVSVAVTALDGTAAAVITSANIPGTNTNDPVTDSLCAITTLRTGIAGRSNRGRMYWPGLGVDLLAADGYSVASAFRTGFQSAVDAWLAAMASSGETLGVLSRTLSSFREVTSLEVRTTLGTQRRRLKGGVIF